eukprot:GHVR01180228.1.p1 GENE.GHVR01180228.1~~GHVR01180228.1.p1  ORF type:complete len:426 (+),score=48.12 GHVR01180228.1:73-1350(+)
MGYSNSTFPWLECLFVFVIIIESWEQYLSWRQYKRNCDPMIPHEVSALIEDKDVYKKSQKYNSEKKLFSIIKSLITFVITWSTILIGWQPYIWNMTIDIVGNQEYYRSVVFVLINLVIDLVLGLPFEIYYDFVIEEKHGFNKKNAQIFITDMLKSTAIQVVITVPVLCAIIFVINWGGESFYIYAWVVVMALTISMQYIYPNIIAPLFNKFEPLTDLDLKEKIEKLAEEHNFPLTKLFQVDGSKRSAHSNAYFYGICGQKRVVLYDTLLKAEHKEILAVLAHELGHWYHMHMYQMIAIVSAQVFAMFYLYGLVMYTPSLYTSFKFNGVEPAVIGLFLFSLVFTPVSHILSVLFTLLVRRNEFMADRFAVRLGYSESLVDGLKRLHKDNLGDLNPDPLYSWFNLTHPPLVERIQAIKKAENNKKTQ